MIGKESWVREVDQIWDVTEGASRSKQHDGEDNRLKEVGFDQCVLEYLQAEIVRAGLDAPPRNSETGSVGRE
jgi:hypothetical protein